MLTSEEYSPRLSELGKIELHLQKDPVEEGLSGISARLAELQGQKQKLSKFLLEAINNRTEADIILKDKTYDYERKLDVLYATDKTVQSQKNAEMRKAAANQHLLTELKAVHDANIAHIEADSYYKSVNQINALLDSAKDNLSRQITMIQLEVNTGLVTGDDFTIKESRFSSPQGKRIHIESSNNKENKTNG